VLSFPYFGFSPCRKVKVDLPSPTEDKISTITIRQNICRDEARQDGGVLKPYGMPRSSRATRSCAGPPTFFLRSSGFSQPREPTLVHHTSSPSGRLQRITAFAAHPAPLDSALVYQTYATILSARVSRRSKWSRNDHPASSTKPRYRMVA